LGVVLASAERGAGALGPWSGFVGVIALCVLIAGLVQGSVRVLGAAAGLLGVVAALAGNGRINGLHGAVEDGLVAAGLLLVVELGSWSAEARAARRQTPAFTGVDGRRLAFVLGSVVGGGGLAGLAVAVATTTRGVLAGILPVIGGAAAGLLLLLLALALATPGPDGEAPP
jgi:hypothetical protein